MTNKFYDRNRQIKEEYELGERVAEISEKYNLSIRRVQTLIKEKGWTRKKDVRKISREEKLIRPQQVYIYLIDFDEHGVYIGQTKSLKKRIDTHIFDAVHGKHTSRTVNKLAEEKGKTYICDKFKNPTILYCTLQGTRTSAIEKEYYFRTKYIDMGHKVLGGAY